MTPPFYACLFHCSTDLSFLDWRYNLYSAAYPTLAVVRMLKIGSVFLFLQFLSLELVWAIQV
jgi:hypothetical protein